MTDPLREAERAAAAVALMEVLIRMLRQISVEGGDAVLDRLMERMERDCKMQQQRQLRRYDLARLCVRETPVEITLGKSS